MKYLPLALILVLYTSLLIFRVLYIDIPFDVENPKQFVELREDLDKRLSTLLPTPNYELLSGILLGEKKNLPGDLKIALRDTSTLHIVVVSGQNLSFIAGLLLGLAGVVHRRSAILISFCAILFYTLLTGAQVPVIRAAIMSTFALMAVFLGKQKHGAWMLFVSAALMILVNPDWIGDLSFQLSFLATFGVIVVAPAIDKYFKSLPDIIRQDFSVAFGAQLMVTPIIAQSFHQFSVVGIIVNLLVGWTVSFIMILGSLMLLSSYIFEPLAKLTSFITMIFLDYFLHIVRFFAELEFAWEYVGEKSWFFWLGYYLLVGGILLLINSYKKPKI